MPEGPSIIILKDEAEQFKGEKIIEACGNTTKINTESLKGKTVYDFKSWGKQFLICIDNFAIRVHFLLYGTYRVNERKELKPRLSLQFKNGELNFYSCSVKCITENLDAIYDWSSDVMSPEWSATNAKNKLNSKPKTMVCDALLDQHIFSGVGNIIKNEVLYRIKVHPENLCGDLPESKVDELIEEAVHYSFDFLKWKKEFTLKVHWLVHTKKVCLRCNLPIIKKHSGRTKRRTFFCENCQVLY